jgi:hypothetical protein
MRGLFRAPTPPASSGAAIGVGHLGGRGMREAFTLGGASDDWDHIEPLPLPLDGHGPPATFAGDGRHLRHPAFGLLAVRVDERRWRVFFHDPARDVRRFNPEIARSHLHASVHHHVEISVPTGLLPVGVAVEARASEPVMVVRDEDRRGLSLLQRTTQRGVHTRLPRGDSPIRWAATTPSAPCVAWHTEAGEIVVWSFERGAVVLRVIPDAGTGPEGGP